MTGEDYDWGLLAESAEAGMLAPVPGTLVRGEEAARSGRDALLEATGAASWEQAARVALGRPRLGQDRDANVTWKVRAPEGLDRLLGELARNEGKTRSALIREAVAEYARNRHVA